jgi:tetratricopeptide (TPR) repeat protein
MTLRAFIIPFSDDEGTLDHLQIFFDYLTEYGVDILRSAGMQELIPTRILSNRSEEAEMFFWIWTFAGRQSTAQPASKVLPFCDFVPMSFAANSLHFPQDLTIEWLRRLEQLHIRTENLFELHITLGYLREIFTLSLRFSDALSVAKQLVELAPAEVLLVQDEMEFTDGEITEGEIESMEGEIESMEGEMDYLEQTDLIFFTKIYEFFALVHLLIANNNPESDLQEAIQKKFVVALRDSQSLFGEYDQGYFDDMLQDFERALVISLIEPHMWGKLSCAAALSRKFPGSCLTKWYLVLKSRCEESKIVEKCQKLFLLALEDEWIRLIHATSMNGAESSDEWIRMVFMSRLYFKRQLAEDLDYEMVISREARAFKDMFPSRNVLVPFSQQAATRLFEYYCREDDLQHADSEFKLICVSDFDWIDRRMWSRWHSLSEEAEVLAIKWLEEYLRVRFGDDLLHATAPPGDELFYSDFSPELQMATLLEVLTMLHLGASNSARSGQLESLIPQVLQRLSLYRPPVSSGSPEFSSSTLRTFLDIWIFGEFPKSEIRFPAAVAELFCVAVNCLLHTEKESEDKIALKKMLHHVMEHVEGNEEATRDVRERVLQILNGIHPHHSSDKHKAVIWALPDDWQSASTESVREVRNYFSEFFFIDWDKLPLRFDDQANVFQEATTAFRRLHGLGNLQPQAAKKIREATLSRCLILLRNPHLLFWKNICTSLGSASYKQEWMKLLYILLALVCVDRSSDPSTDSSQDTDQQILSHVPYGPVFCDCLFFIARLYTFQGRFKHAVQFFQRIVERSTNIFALYPCYYGLASLNLHIGDESTAVEHFAKYYACSGPVALNFRRASVASVPTVLKDLMRLLKRRIYDSSVLWPLGAQPKEFGAEASDECRRAVGQISIGIIPFGLDYVREHP